MNKISINQKQRLYVIPCGKGYSCLGWDVCQKWTEALHKELVKIDIAWAHKFKSHYPKGTYLAYNKYEEMIAAACAINYNTGYRFTYQLEPRLIGLEGKRVEVTSKDGSKRRFYVGKSTGCIPIHLTIAKRTSIGGPEVCILDTDTIKVVGDR